MVAAAVLVIVIAVRTAWHMSFNAVIRRRDRRFGFHPPRPMLRSTVGSGPVIFFGRACAASSRSPRHRPCRNFPMRDLVLLTARSVVLGTLGPARSFDAEYESAYRTAPASARRSLLAMRDKA